MADPTDNLIIRYAEMAPLGYATVVDPARALHELTTGISKPHEFRIIRRHDWEEASQAFRFAKEWWKVIEKLEQPVLTIKQNPQSHAE